MNETPDGGIRAFIGRTYGGSGAEVETVKLQYQIERLSREVDRLQMENAELRYERDAARLARVIPDSDGYSDGEVWAS